MYYISPSTYPFNLTIHLFIYPPMHFITHPFIYLSIHLPSYSSTYLSTHLSIYLRIYLSIDSSIIHPSLNLSNHPSIHLLSTTHLSINSTITFLILHFLLFVFTIITFLLHIDITRIRSK